MLKFIRSTAAKIIFFILLVSFVGFCFAFPHKLVTAKNIFFAHVYIYKGDQQYSKQDLYGAITYYQKALSLYPAHYKANYNLANIYAAYEDYFNALIYYENALRYRKKFMNARIALGILLSEKFFEYDRAIKEYNTAVELSPFEINIPLIFNNKNYVRYNKSSAYHNKGLAYKWKSLVYGQGKYESDKNLHYAIDAYENAIKLDKNYYDSYFNLALCYHLLGNIYAAKKYYCKCIHIKPFDYDAHYNLAILLRGEKNYIDAMVELEKAALIVDADNDAYKTRYIFDVLNETSSKFYAQETYSNIKENLTNSPFYNYTPTFVNGKVVASEELDLAMEQNMKTCKACEDIK